ncbi:MAG: hypothetical protein B1H03_00110 [Planctomycetales bacterium 4484_113]|nr:MAG: hypothetical protein B1H03_00110 [Planctomycetales bacterium 4484_113]
MMTISRFFVAIWRFKWVFLGVIIVLAALGFGIWANSDHGRGKAEETTYTVTRADITRTETVIGVLEATSQVEVKAKVGGVLKEVLVKEGDPVKKGALLARIDEADLRKVLRQAQAHYELAEAQYAKAKQGGTREQVSSLEASLKNAQVEMNLARENLERVKSLYEKGYSSDQEYEDAKGRWERAQAAYDDAKRRLDYAKTSASAEDIAIARAQLKQAKIQLDSAHEDLENAAVRSEVNGKVLSVEMDPGDTVVPSVGGREGLPIMIVGDTTSILVKSEIGEDLIGVLKEGMPVEFSLSFIKDRKVAGEISRISHFGKPNENGVVMFPIEMELTESIGEPRLGSTARGTITVESAKNALALPVIAIGSSGEKKVVKKLLQNGKTETVEVETGVSDGRLVEIKSGLTEGDKVVAELTEDAMTKPSASSRRGMRVVVRHG